MAIDTRADDRSGSIDHRDEVVAEKPSTDVEHAAGTNTKPEGYIPNDDEYNVTFKTWVVVGVMATPFATCLSSLLTQACRFWLSHMASPSGLFRL